MSINSHIQVGNIISIKITKAIGVLDSITRYSNHNNNIIIYNICIAPYNTIL